ncbi:hypothetical protein AB3S75_022982 [Citrus x aurantiifolia]
MLLCLHHAVVPSSFLKLNQNQLLLLPPLGSVSAGGGTTTSSLLWFRHGRSTAVAASLLRRAWRPEAASESPSGVKTRRKKTRSKPKTMAEMMSRSFHC